MAICISSFLFGCAVKSGPVLIKDGQKYGHIDGIWGGNYWDYYARGVSYAKGEFWNMAIPDFQKAMRLRNQDQRQVRIYGLRILDDYFPHREAGIAFYENHQIEKAIQELSYSLSCYPSAKAKFYLDLAREAQLRQTNLDSTPPEVSILSHQNKQFIKESEIIIEGSAWDDYFVKKIKVNEVPYPIELAQPHIPFKISLTLHQGVNDVFIVIEDLVGQQTEERFQLLVDRQAPLLYINDLTITSETTFVDLNTRKVAVTGYVSDFSGVANLQIDQTQIFLSPKGYFQFQGEMPASADFFSFVAEDLLGNQVEGKIRVSDDLLHSNSQGPLRVASLNLAGLSDTDESAPTIVLDSPKNETMIVDWEELFICGHVHDLGGVRDLFVNDESILSHEGKSVYFNYIVKLHPGENIIRIEAFDLAGNEKSKVIKIERKINQVHQIGFRMSMAVMPFKYRGDTHENQRFIADRLINSFVAQERFRLVDRERIDRIVSQKYEGKLDDPQFSPIEVGKLVSAESVMAGCIYEHKGFIEIIARLIDTESSVILDSQDVYGEGGENTIDLLKGLALKFKNSFPMVEGMIIEKDGKNILVNLGHKQHIKEYTKYIVFRNGEKITDPFTHEVLEQKYLIMGEAKIFKVLERISEADLLEDSQLKSIKIKDYVITK